MRPISDQVGCMHDSWDILVVIITKLPAMFMHDHTISWLTQLFVHANYWDIFVYVRRSHGGVDQVLRVGYHMAEYLAH